MSIRDLLPTEGWLKDFLDHSSKLMMSPPEFRLGVAIATLSATIGRSVSLPAGAERTLEVERHFFKLTFRRSGPRFLPPPRTTMPDSAVGEGRFGQAHEPKKLAMKRHELRIKALDHFAMLAEQVAL